MEEEVVEQGKSGKRPKGRRWRRVLGVVVLVLAGLLIWLNGPGLRWLGPRVAFRYLEKAGLRGDFRLEGSVTGGLSVADLRLEGDAALAKVTVDRARPVYRFGELVRGKLIGFEAEGVHVDLRLGLEKEEEEKPPLDLEALVRTIRNVRGQVVPLELKVEKVSVSAVKEGEPVFVLERSDFHHAAGSGVFDLKLGRIVAADGRELAAQETELRWEPDRLVLDELDPYPGVGIRELAVDLPESGEPRAMAKVLLEEAVFELETAPGFSAATLGLRSGELQVDRTARSFGVELPVAARLTSLSVNVEGILPEPAAATGMVQVVLEEVAWEDWEAPELVLGATLEERRATAALRLRTLETPVTLDAAAPVSRSEAGFQLGEAEGTLGVEDVRAAVGELAKRYDAVREEAEVPVSSLAGTFRVSFGEGNRPLAAEGELALNPQDEALATRVVARGRWQGEQPVTAEVELDGLKADGRYELAARRYSGTLALDGFRNERVDRWLAIAGVELGGDLDVSGRWNGGGDLEKGRHEGELVLEGVEWVQEGMAPVSAGGTVKYDWPVRVEAPDLVVGSEAQTIAVDAVLAEGLLELRRFLWSDGEEEMAEGTASLPVPEEFGNWRETLALDRRPVKVDLESRVLSLAKLRPWLPATAALDERSTGQLRVKVEGSYAEPVVDAALELLDLRTPAREDLPPADLRVTLKGSEARMVLDGTVTAPDFAPAVIRAEMAFRPADWAAAPESIKEEAVEARVDLPRLDLSRFTTLVPPAKELRGVVTGHVAVTGKVGAPEIRGTVNLADGGLVFTDPLLPAVTGVAADVEATLAEVRVRTLRALVAGGSVQGEGSLGLEGGALGPVDFRLRGNHLPIVRNDLMIVRANGDLRLQGAWEAAVLSGSVGVVDSLFYRDIELLPIGVPFTTPSAASLPKIDTPENPTAGVPEPFRNWRVDVAVRTEEPFLIRGNLGTGEVDVGLRVGGTIGSPAPDGTVRIRDGVAALPFSTLRVRSGTLRFSPENGFDPVLEVRGIAEPRPYRVDVYVYGRLSDPQLMLTSNPPLPENEIMTLLATGTTTSGLEDTQAASSRALQLLVEEARRGRLRFARQLRPLLGIVDRVDFNLAEKDPYDSDSFSTATIKLTDRYYLSAGMSSDGDTRVLGIWRLTFR